MNRRALWAAILLTVRLASSAEAQEPSLPEPIAQHRIQTPEPNLLGTWAEYYFSNRWSLLQAEVRNKLTVSEKDLHLDDRNIPEKKVHIFDFRQNYYRVIFVSTFRKETGELIQFLVHDPDPEPYVNRLPGVRQLYDVFIAPDEAATLKSSYLSTRVADPFIEKLPSFFAKAFDFTRIARFDIAAPEAAAVKPSVLYVDISLVNLPRKRATIAISDEATVPLGLVTAAQSEELKQKLTLRHARGSDCAVLLAENLDKAIQAELDDQSTLAPPRDPCEEPFFNRPASDEEFKECVPHEVTDETPVTPAERRCLIQKRMKKTYEAVVGCHRDCKPGGEKDFAPVLKVEEDFKNLLAGKTLQAKKDMSYENVPLERRSLGLISGVMLETSGDRRFKIESQKITADPLSGALSLAVVNFHPWTFDPKSEIPSFGEKFRLFGGTVLTPEFGVTAGAGYAFFRGISINAGMALMRVDTLRPGDEVGEGVDTLVKPKDPFKDGWSNTFFVGLGFNF